MLTVFSRLNNIPNTLPPVLETGKEIQQVYPKETDMAYEDFKNNPYFQYLKDEYKNNLTKEKWLEEKVTDWFPKTIDYKDPEVIRIAQENKDKIINRLKRYEVPKETRMLYFWVDFSYFLHDYQEKLKREEKKIKELREREERQRIQQEKRDSKKRFVPVRDIFDKGSEDLIWKFLLEYKKETLEFFDKIEKDYKQLNKDKDFYWNYISKKPGLLNTYKKKQIPEKILYLFDTKGYSVQDIVMALLPENKRKKIMEDEIDFKYADIVNRINHLCKGKITKVDLHIGRNGSVNGLIYYEGGVIKVETILAAGPIQRPHFRVLIK